MQTCKSKSFNFPLILHYGRLQGRCNTAHRHRVFVAFRLVLRRHLFQMDSQAGELLSYEPERAISGNDRQAVAHFLWEFAQAHSL